MNSSGLKPGRNPAVSPGRTPPKRFQTGQQLLVWSHTASARR